MDIETLEIWVLGQLEYQPCCRCLSLCRVQVWCNLHKPWYCGLNWGDLRVNLIYGMDIDYLKKYCSLEVSRCAIKSLCMLLSCFNKILKIHFWFYLQSHKSYCLEDQYHHSPNTSIKKFFLIPVCPSYKSVLQYIWPMALFISYNWWLLMEIIAWDWFWISFHCPRARSLFYI